MPKRRRSSPHRAPKPGCRHFLIDNLPDATRLPLEAQAKAAGISLTEHIRRTLHARATAVEFNYRLELAAADPDAAAALNPEARAMWSDITTAPKGE